MILEVATITIQPDRSREFAAVFAEARKVIDQADGCGSIALRRSIETPGRYLLFVEWPTVAHHAGFRASPLFQEWRRLMGPFFAAAPAVEHYELVS